MCSLSSPMSPRKPSSFSPPLVLRGTPPCPLPVVSARWVGVFRIFSSRMRLPWPLPASRAIRTAPSPNRSPRRIPKKCVKVGKIGNHRASDPNPRHRSPQKNPPNRGKTGNFGTYQPHSPHDALLSSAISALSSEAGAEDRISAYDDASGRVVADPDGAVIFPADRS
jgi:hypothetical protein